MLVLGLKFLMYGHAVYIPFHLMFRDFQQKFIPENNQKKIKNPVSKKETIFTLDGESSLPEKLGLGLKVWEERMQKKHSKEPKPNINIDIK